MKAVVFGYGGIGAQRAQALSRNKSISSIHIVESRPLQQSDLPKNVQLTTYADALSQSYDLAVVATPHDTAAELTQLLCGKAKAILIEKPLGRTLFEAHKIAEKASQSDTCLYVGFNYRFLKNVRHLKSLMESKQYGSLLGVTATLAHGAQPGYEVGWKTDKVRCGGGVCIDPGVHVFDLLEWLFGPTKLVTGMLSKSYWNIEVEDHASLAFSINDTIPASVQLSISSWQSRFEIAVELENAQIFLRGRGKFYGSQTIEIVRKWPWLHPDKPRSESFDFGSEDDSLKQEIDAVTASLSGAAPSQVVATTEAGLKTMAIVDSCYEQKFLKSSPVQRTEK
jgi:predicted dehydrogenase